MYRFVSLIVAGLVMAGLAVSAEPPANPGDDPPLLKKKGAPDVDDSGLKAPADDKDKKPDAPKPDGDKAAEKAKPRPDADEVLKDVAKSMHQAEEHLAKKELGDPTRQAEEDALKGLDSLIDLADNPPDDPDDKDKQSNSKDSKDNKSSNQGSKDQKDNSSAGKPDASRARRQVGVVSVEPSGPAAPAFPEGPGQERDAAEVRRPILQREAAGDAGRSAVAGSVERQEQQRRQRRRQGRQ